MAALGFVVVSLPGSASAVGNPNDAPYWEAYLGDGSDCFKHGPWDQSVHGSVTNDGKAVTLATFNPDWEQDFWRLVVVNGGSNDTVVEFPSAGVAYFPPLNNGGQPPDISHWIVCKGYNNDEPEDTTTTVVVDETTTTVAVEESTTTVAAPTTTAASSVSTPAPVPVPFATASTPAPGAPTTEASSITVEQLPETGPGLIGALIAAGFATLAIGGGMLWLRRRPA